MKRLVFFAVLFVAGWIFFDEVVARFANFVLAVPDATLERVVEVFIWAGLVAVPVLLVWFIYRLFKRLRSRRAGQNA